MLEFLLFAPTALVLLGIMWDEADRRWPSDRQFLTLEDNL